MSRVLGYGVLALAILGWAFSAPLIFAAMTALTIGRRRSLLSAHQRAGWLASALRLRRVTRRMMLGQLVIVGVAGFGLLAERIAHVHAGWSCFAIGMGLSFGLLFPLQIAATALSVALETLSNR